ncbi:MAG: glycosyltransferase family 4 protein [Nocardioidaceae bacterium]
MKILHVVEVSHGGVVSLAETFADLQSEQGHEVHMLAQPDTVGDVRNTHAWGPRRRSPRRLLDAHRRLTELVRRERFDIVHLHSFFAGLLGRLRGLGSSAVVYQPHSWAFEAAPTPLGPRTVGGWEKRAARRTHALVTNCTEEKEEGARFGVDVPATVIGLPLDTERYRPGDDKDRASSRERLGLTSRHVLVCVGRLSRQKGQVALAEQWERDPLPDTTLVLVGPGDPGDIASAAPRTFGDSLRHVGPQTYVRPWLWAADLCIQPSLYEGQSVAMAEALACGTPVVMTEVNGAREVICGSGVPAAGRVVPVGDMPGLLRAARELLHDDVRRQTAGELARDVAVRHFESSAVLRRLDDVYDRALDRAAAS